jgi:Leucine-rich repeat (LRR) protein
LTTLPKSLGQLNRLRYLNIADNVFATLSAAVAGMAGLIELRADGNQLTSLPEWIGELRALRELHRRNNRLTTLPASIGTLRDLRQLDLRGNPLCNTDENGRSFQLYEFAVLRNRCAKFRQPSPRSRSWTSSTCAG